MSRVSMDGRRRCGIGAALLVILLSAVPALAEPTTTEMEKARAAWVTGALARSNGKHAEALTAFETAHAIMGLPVTGIDVAREREALGLLIEARDMALSVTRMDATTPANKQAQTEALALYGRVGPKIGAIEIAVTGPPAGTELHVEVDGESIPSATASVPRRVNPGQHTLTVSASGHVAVTRTVQVAESATLRVEMTLVPAESNDTQPASKSIPRAAQDLVGRNVILTLKDDTLVTGILLSIDDRQLVVDLGGGKRTHVERGQARSVRALAAGETAPGGVRAAPERAAGPSGVRIHIETNDPEVSLYRVSDVPTVAVARLAYSSYQASPPTPWLTPKVPTSAPAGPSMGWLWGSVTREASPVLVCAAPCDRIVDTAFGDDLFLGIDGYQLGRSFQLYGGGYDLRLSAKVERRPSRGLRVTGRLLSILGASALLAGGVLLVMDATLDTEDLVPAGAATLGAGAASLGLGIGLFLRSRPIYEVDVPGDTVSRLLSPALAFTPPMPARGGAAPAWVGASWSF